MSVVSHPRSLSEGVARVEQASRLLPEIFEGVDPKHGVTALEFGPAVPETIAFFGQFKCRVHVANLFENEAIRTQQAELDEAALKEAFRAHFNFPRGTLLDVCLFWDFLNYLRPATLRALSAALQPYLHAGTCGHGFSVLSVETPLNNREYGVLRPDVICNRPARMPQMDYFPHTHEGLDRGLPAFKIQKGWLLSDGRLEMLFQARI